MSIYIPATVALIIKLYIFYRYRNSWMVSAVSRILLSLMVVQTIANVLELVSYYYGTSLVSTLLLLKIYYVALFWLVAFLLQVSILIVIRKSNSWVGVITYIVATVMSAVLLFSDLFIMGSESIGYTVTRVPGPHYWAIQLYAILMSILPIGICVYGYRTLENHFDRIRCMYILLAVSCQATPMLIAIVAMALGFQISAAVMLPIGNSLFLLVMAYALSNEELYDIREWIPFTQIYKIERDHRKELMVASDGSIISAKERKRLQEKRHIARALVMTNGNQRQAAKKLGISESAISQKRRQYGI